MISKSKEVGISSCGLRMGSKYHNRTAGATWMMCCCGMLFPAVETPEAESTRMTLLTMLCYFQHYPYPEGFVIVFDDMCHLLRYGCAFGAAVLPFETSLTPPDVCVSQGRESGSHKAEKLHNCPTYPTES